MPSETSTPSWSDIWACILAGKSMVARSTPKSPAKTSPWAVENERHQGEAGLLGEGAGEAEVEAARLAVRHDHHVPAVEVAVEHTVDAGALEEAHHERREHR